MKRLVTLNNPRMAQAFIDYMASRHIDIQMMPEGEGQFALWLTDAQHEIEVEAELKQFLANPSASKYSAASWDVADSRKSKFHYSSPSIMGMVKAKAGPVTLLIMAVCTVIYFLQMFGFGDGVFALLHFPASKGSSGNSGAGSAMHCCTSPLPTSCSTYCGGGNWVVISSDV